MFHRGFVIGSAQALLYKRVPDAYLHQLAAFLAGGPFGIVTGMWVHRRFIGRRENKRKLACD